MPRTPVRSSREHVPDNAAADVAHRARQFGACLDIRDWQTLLMLFSDLVSIDYTALFGGQPQRLHATELIEQWRQVVPGFTRTRHLIGEPAVAITGKVAALAASLVAWHFVTASDLEGEDWWLVGGRYDMAFGLTKGVWRIDSVALRETTTMGNDDLLRVAARRVRENQHLSTHGAKI